MSKCLGVIANFNWRKNADIKSANTNKKEVEIMSKKIVIALLCYSVIGLMSTNVFAAFGGAGAGSHMAVS